MREENRDTEGYPADPEARAQEKRLEQMLGQLPPVRAPRSLRAEVMAELRATPPGLSARVRRWWRGLGGWRIPIQLAPVATLVAAVFVVHSMIDLGPGERGQASVAPTAPDGDQIALATEPSSRTDLGTPPTAVHTQPEPRAIKPSTPRRDVSALAVFTSRSALRSLSPEEEPTPEVAVAETPLLPPETEPVENVTPESDATPLPDTLIAEEIPAEDPLQQEPEVHIATPLGAGTREEVTRDRPMLPLPEDIRPERERLRSETLIQSIDVAALPEPDELPLQEPRVRIESQRIEPTPSTGLGTPPPEGSAFNTTYTGNQVTPPGLAFQGGNSLTPEDFQEARERAAIWAQTPPANAQRAPTNLNFTVDNPEAFADSARTVIEDYSGRVISALPVTSDGRTWRVTAEMPQWRIEYLRRELTVLASSGDTDQIELPPEPQQLPPAMRRYTEVRVVIQSTLPSVTE